MQLNFFLSILVCHSTPQGDGQDEILDLKIVLDPTKTLEAVSILALGISAKHHSHESQHMIMSLTLYI